MCSSDLDIVAQYNKARLSESPILTPQQRTNFLSQADMQFKQRLGEQSKIDDEYASYADGMGIPRESYGEVLSSGEATRDALIARDDPFFAKLGNRAFHLGPERDRTVFEDTGVEIVDDIDIVRVVDAHLAYFAAIGAVGPHAEAV